MAGRLLRTACVFATLGAALLPVATTEAACEATKVVTFRDIDRANEIEFDPRTERLTFKTSDNQTFVSTKVRSLSSSERLLLRSEGRDSRGRDVTIILRADLLRGRAQGSAVLRNAPARLSAPVLIANSVGTVSITFTSSRGIPADGQILVQFPPGFDVSGAEEAVSPAITSAISISAGQQVVTLALDGSGQRTAPGSVRVDIKGIRNPPVPGVTAGFIVEVRDGNGRAIDANASVGGVLVQADTLSTVSGSYTTRERLEAQRRRGIPAPRRSRVDPNRQSYIVVVDSGPAQGERCYFTPKPGSRPADQTPFDPSKFVGSGDKYDCKDFASQARAQAVLRADAKDPNKLDPDKDGLACDKNPAPFDLNKVRRT